MTSIKSILNARIHDKRLPK